MAAPVKFKPIHPIATILGHLRLIALVSVGGTALCVLLILWKVKPLYRAGAAIEITQKVGHVLKRDQDKQFVSRIQYTDFVNTQVNYIVGYENVAETLRKLDLSKTCVVQQPTEAETVAGFLRMLEVGWVPNTNLLGIGVSSSDPRGLDLLANTLVDTYMENTVARETSVNDESIRHLREEKASKRKELAEMNIRLSEYTTRLGTLVTEESSSPLEENLTFLRGALNDAYVDRLDAEQTYQALVTRFKKEKGLGVSSLVEERVLEDLSTMRNEMYDRMAEINRNSALMSADHPQMKQLEERLAADRANLDKAMADLRRDAAEVIQGRLDREQKTMLYESEAVLEAAIQKEQELRARYQNEQAMLKDTIPVFLESQQLRTEIDQIHALISLIDTRIEELTTEARAPSRMRVQSLAREPMNPAKNRRRIFAVLALFMCTTLALMIAFAIDFLDSSIISPQHMAQIVGKRPTGVLAHHNMSDFGQLLRTYPDSYEADQFRRMMPRIFHRSLSREKPGIFVVIPLAPGAGVTSFALNCMTHLSDVGQGVGLLTLSGDEDSLLKRTAAWGLKEEPLNLPTHLREKLPITLRTRGGIECYHFSTPVGKQVLSDKELLSELVHLLAGRTGCLLVESSSILQHAEAELFCSFAEVVMLVVNGPETSPGELRRGVGLLEEIGVAQCAVIANNLPVLPGGYFAAAKAAFEGRELNRPLLGEVGKALRKALWLGGRS